MQQRGIGATTENLPQSAGSKGCNVVLIFLLTLALQPQDGFRGHPETRNCAPYYQLNPTQLY